jgi:transcriptional regulator with PAS, ATPase and Fis domain
MHDDSTTIKASSNNQYESHDLRRFLLILYQEESSRVFDLSEGQELVVGRGPEVEVIIDDSRISRRHARIWREENKVWVEDLGSTNGTRVNEVPIPHKQRIGPGDAIGLGSATLVVSSLTLNVGQHRLYTDGEFEEQLEMEIDRAKRYRRSMSVLMIHLPGRVEAIHKNLLAIATSLRKMDRLAAYSPYDYVILLPEVEVQAASAIAQRFFQTIDQEMQNKAHLATASFPVEAHSAGMLLDVVRSRLRQAKRGGPKASLPPLSKPIDQRVVVAQSRLMIQTLSIARRIGATDSTVLILGETGSGKQVVAEEIHHTSQRAKGPLLHINCAALPPTLFESELFGYERGAFTGADRRHSGYVEAAAEGTLFLDEIGELPEQTQAKLLHLLESRMFTRLGGIQPLKANVRIIAATNRDLETEVKQGRFREDLYFRLSVFVLQVPALRERPEDIVPLAKQFVNEFAISLGRPEPEISPRVLQILQNYHWPGNVRQLRNAMERALVLAEENVIEDSHLPERVLTQPADALTPFKEALDEHLAGIEATRIETMLKECKGNQSEAARRLGITRRALIYRMEKYGLH